MLVSAVSEVIQMERSNERVVHERVARVPAIRTDAVHVVFTTLNDTLAALRVGADMAKAMGVPLKLVHFRTIPYALSVDRPVGVSPIETEDFLDRVRADGIELRARVYLCRHERRAIPLAFKRRSIVVVAGRHRRWPTAEERLRRHLEAAGHYVVFVDADEHRETARA